METRVRDLDVSLKKETEIRDNLQTSTDNEMKRLQEEANGKYQKLQEASETEIASLKEALEAQRQSKEVFPCDNRNLK